MQFTVFYRGARLSSKLSRSDDCRIRFDDALAQDDFACCAVLTLHQKISLTLGHLLPGETCTVTVSFVSQCSALDNAFIFVFPPAIIDQDQHRHFPSYSVVFTVSDDLPITSVATTNFKSDPVFSPDRKTVNFSVNSVSCVNPFTVSVVLQVDTLTRCLRSSFSCCTYLFVTSTAPVLREPFKPHLR
jgi:hypothetical protein